MRLAPALLLGLSLCVVAPVLAPKAAHAGVPRSCMARSYDPIRCPRETRRVSLGALGPTARVRQLERLEAELAAVVVPLQDEERNLLLREITDLLRYPAPRR